MFTQDAPSVGLRDLQLDGAIGSTTPRCLPMPLRGYNGIRVNAEESYAANCRRGSERVLLPAGSPGREDSLKRLGYVVLPLGMSEFRKIDGGLSCLSLRF